jgi:Xaa-Pro aminopeptidase
MWEPAGGLVEELRMSKDAGEVDEIRRSVRVAEEALADFIGCVEEGVSERDLASELVFRLRSGGSDSLPFDPIVASGPRSALPHARPGERELREGDLLLVDFGASVGGYCSDMTRMFSLGPPAPWQRELHALVTRAVEEAITAAEAGVAAREVDRAARDVIDGAGFGERFGHGTGHGVGLEVHEKPSVNARSRDVLPGGSVVTIEPAVYLPGRGGVRLEEMVLVVEGGRTVLTSFPLELREI